MRAKKSVPGAPALLWKGLLLCLGWCLLALAAPSLAAPPAAPTEVRIGALAHRGPEKTMQQWQATADYLNENITSHNFKIVPLDFQQIGPATRDNRIDFVIANPAIYVELETLYGATRIATLKKPGAGAAATQYGSVIFCRSDRDDIRTLDDLKGKSFLAVDETSLGGWQMAWHELHLQGIDPYHDFRTLGFTGTHDAAVYGVLDKKADAGTARSETLEKLAKSGKIDLAKVRVLNRKESGAYQFLASTQLYPEWPIARLKNTGDELATAVAVALLRLPPDSAAARNADLAGWTTPMDYTLVHTLLRELHLGPYRDYGKLTWATVWGNHRHLVVAFAIILLLVVVFIVVIVFLNNRVQLSYKASEKLGRELDLILNSAGDGIFGLDREGCHTFINAAGAAMLGYSPAELIGKPSHDLCHHTNKDGLPFPSQTCPIYSVYRDGKTHTEADDVFWRKDGGSFPVEYMSTPILEGATVVGAVVVFRDITHRKQTEANLQLALEESRDLAGELANQHAILQEQNAQLEVVFGKVEQAKREWELSMDRLDDMIILLDADGRIKRLNRQFQDFLGLFYEEIIGKAWDDIVSAHGLADLLLANSSAVHTKMYVRHAATNTWYRCDAFPYHDDKLQISGRIITLHNYTEVKLANDALALTNAEIERNRVVLQGALDQLAKLLDLVIQENDLSVRFENPNLQSCREVMHCSHAECTCYASDNVRCWLIAGTYCGGKAQGAYVDKFGTCAECPVYLHAVADPVYMIGESFNNMMHILEVQHLNLEKAYDELKTAQATILQQEKMASVGQLAAGVAHEINNPMGFISSNLGSLSKYLERLAEFIATQGAALGNPEEIARVAEARKKLKIDYIIQDTRDLIAESLDGADRVKKIVQNLKSFSRVDQAEEQPVDLNECLETTLNIIWNELKYKTTVRKEYGDLPRLKCFPQQLNQVFMNLLVNGAQAIDKQGEITIRTWVEAGAIRVAISDTGGGIPADKLNRIFEPFFTTKPVGKGTGLGLSICYDIVKKHGGEILVMSTEGIGSTFTVVLPIKENGEAPVA
ncbi:MAG: PhnD/SsuA/transferrin family substrate-binding protein [Desulfobulbaceae bacterium]|nr:PhnD/SsuA/transferrin family substrate-binding protein [Desulfobulbaceae bacterium]